MFIIIENTCDKQELCDQKAINMIVCSSRSRKWRAHSRENLQSLKTTVVNVQSEIRQMRARYLEKYHSIQNPRQEAVDLDIKEFLPRFTYFCEKLLAAIDKNMKSESGWRKALAQLEQDFSDYWMQLV
jgi:hypothetical protein